MSILEANSAISIDYDAEDNKVICKINMSLPKYIKDRMHINMIIINVLEETIKEYDKELNNSYRKKIIDEISKLEENQNG